MLGIGKLFLKKHLIRTYFVDIVNLATDSYFLFSIDYLEAED